MLDTPGALPGADARGRLSGFRERVGVLRYSMSHFLAALAILLIATPFLERFERGHFVEAGLFTLVLLSAVLAVGGNHKSLAWAGALVVPALVSKWLNHIRPDLAPPEIYLTAALIFISLVTVRLLRFILRAARVDSEVLCAGIAVYLLLGLSWGIAYILADRIDPAAFVFTADHNANDSLRGSSALYFSFITLSTCGYGDIVPKTGPMRMLAAAEATVGVLYMAILIARLVAMHTVESATSGDDARRG